MSISFKLYVDILRKGHIALSNSRPHVVVSVLGRCTWINFTGSIVFAQLFAQGVDILLMTSHIIWKEVIDVVLKCWIINLVRLVFSMFSIKLDLS